MLNAYKIVTGEDIIGDVIEETETGIFIENPVSYNITPNQSFQFRDWLLLCKDNVIFLDNKHIVMDLGEPNDFGCYCYESFIRHKKLQKEAIQNYETPIEETIEIQPTEEEIEEYKELLNDLSLKGKIVVH